MGSSGFPSSKYDQENYSRIYSSKVKVGEELYEVTSLILSFLRTGNSYFEGIFIVVAFRLRQRDSFSFRLRLRCRLRLRSRQIQAQRGDWFSSCRVTGFDKEMRFRLRFNASSKILIVFG